MIPTALTALVAGLPDAFGGAVALAGAVILGLMLVALGAYAYRSVRGDGIEWPDDDPDTAEDDTLSHGDDDDEWEYY